MHELDKKKGFGLPGWGMLNPKIMSLKKVQPEPTQHEFGPWGLNSTRLNPFFHPKNGFNPKNRVGFGRTKPNIMGIPSFCKISF